MCGFFLFVRVFVAVVFIFLFLEFFYMKYLPKKSSPILEFINVLSCTFVNTILAKILGTF